MKTPGAPWPYSFQNASGSSDISVNISIIALLLSSAIWSTAATFYWDTDGSTLGNNASTGASLGGSGTWSSGAANWWDTTTLQGWIDGGDAVFWGTAGTVTVSSTVSPNSVWFRTNGYSVNSGTL